ncbi:MAG: response regulator transcription factor [Prevotella sp.]|nr:response regulator transcription factor [Prevotella sp.]
MITCIAIDDEPLALQQITAYIKRVPFLTLVGECQSSLDAKKILDKETVDAIFVDINMPDLSGLDFVKSLDTPPIVVFTTAYAEYAVEGYKVNATDYLLKPFGFDEFLASAEKVRERFELLNAATVSDPDDDDALFLKTEHKVVRINISDIKYIEGMSEYLKIHFSSDKKAVVALLSMKRLEERLPKYFMRIHRSYIINLHEIQEINKSRVILDADTYLPIGDLYRDTLNAYIESKFLGK